MSTARAWRRIIHRGRWPPRPARTSQPARPRSGSWNSLGARSTGAPNCWTRRNGSRTAACCCPKARGWAIRSIRARFSGSPSGNRAGWIRPKPSRNPDPTARCARLSRNQGLPVNDPHCRTGDMHGRIRRQEAHQITALFNDASRSRYLGHNQLVALGTGVGGRPSVAEHAGAVYRHDDGAALSLEPGLGVLEGQERAPEIDFQRVIPVLQR